MTKLQLSLTSLVAAVPAAILAYLLVMTFLSHAQNLQLMSQLLTGGTLLVAVAVVLTPAAVFAFSGPDAPAMIADSAKSSRQSNRQAQNEDDVESLDEGSLDDASVLDEEPSENESSLIMDEDFGETMAFETEESDGDLFTEDLEETLGDDDDLPPKKKRR